MVQPYIHVSPKAPQLSATINCWDSFLSCYQIKARFELVRVTSDPRKGLSRCSISSYPHQLPRPGLSHWERVRRHSDLERIRVDRCSGPSGPGQFCEWSDVRTNVLESPSANVAFWTSRHRQTGQSTRGQNQTCQSETARFHIFFLSRRDHTLSCLLHKMKPGSWAPAETAHVTFRVEPRST